MLDLTKPFNPSNWMGKRAKQYDKDFADIIKSVSTFMNFEILPPETLAFEYRLETVISKTGHVSARALVPDKPKPPQVISGLSMLTTFLNLRDKETEILAWVNRFGPLKGQWEGRWEDNHQPIHFYNIAWQDLRTIYELSYQVVLFDINKVTYSISVKELHEHTQQLNTEWVANAFHNQSKLTSISELPIKGYYLMIKPVSSNNYFPVLQSYRKELPQNKTLWLFETIATVIENYLEGNLILGYKLQENTNLFPYRIVPTIRPLDNLTALWLETKRYFSGQYHKKCQNPDCPEIFMIESDEDKHSSYCPKCRNKTNPAMYKYRQKQREALIEARRILGIGKKQSDLDAITLSNAEVESILKGIAQKYGITLERLKNIVLEKKKI